MFTIKRSSAAAWLLCLLLLGGAEAFPQSASPGAKPAGAPAQPEAPVDALGRNTPLGTVQGFLTAARKRDDQIAASYLNTTLRGEDAAALARRLFVVLNRRMPARINQISNSPEGSTSDSLPLNQELVGTIATRDGKVDVILERVERRDTGSIWLFSADTLAAIPDLYAEISATSRPEQLLPQFLVRTRIFGVPMFAWLAVVLGLPLLYLLAALPVRWVSNLAFRWRPRSLKGIPAGAESAEKPARLLILAFLIDWLASAFGFSLRARQFWVDVANTITIASVVWLLIVVNSWLEEYVRRALASRLVGHASVLRLARRALDTIIVLCGLFVALHYFGVNPTAALAGLGVGGIAVALAAQKTLENVIGGISLILDQAVRVGDSLKVGEFAGTVESVGLRSTRIRTMDRTVVSVPNGQIAAMSLETLSVRDKYWFHPPVRLRRETTLDQMQRVVEGMRALLAAESSVEGDSVRVRFLAFGQTSLDVDVHAYIFAKDWAQFLEIQERLLFRMMEIVQAAGTSLAVPSQVTYIANQPSTDAAALPGKSDVAGV